MPDLITKLRAPQYDNNPVALKVLCLEAAKELERQDIVIGTLREAFDTIFCEEHLQCGDLHGQHQDIGGGCILCAAQKRQAKLEKIARVASGEDQVADDDTEGLSWISQYIAKPFDGD